MIGARRRNRVVPKVNTEYGSSQSRIQGTPSQRQSSIQESINMSNGEIKSCGSLSKNLDKSLCTIGTSSSESEDEFSHISRRLGLLRHLSDYETGESSDRTSRPTRVGIPKDREYTTSTQQSDCDTSSDDSVLSPRIVKNLKRPISVTSESDLSDSSVLVTFKRRSKRMRVLSSSEGRSSDCLSDADNLNRGSAVRNEFMGDVGNTLEQKPAATQCDWTSDRRSGENLIVIPSPNIESLRGRIPVVESESESDLVSPNHIVRGRRIPVIESEDDTSSYEGNGGIGASSVTNVAQTGNSVTGVHNIRSRRRIHSLLPWGNSLRSSRRNGTSRHPRPRNGRTRHPLRNTWRVTTRAEDAVASDDNSVPISNQRQVRGRRIPVIDSEDDSESDTFNAILTLERGSEMSLRSDLTPRRRRVVSSGERNTVSNSNVGGRNAQLIENEDESNNSDSDANIRPRALSNRMEPIFQSDDSSSVSSSSSLDSDNSIPIRNTRRRRPIPIADDYEDIANNVFSSDINIEVSPVPEVHDNQEVLKDNSSDTDGESEKCPICLAGFKIQEIGKPKSCDHKFCLVCIKEWATKNNTCPVDRKGFDLIIVYNQIDGKVVRELPVEKVNPQNDLEFDYWEIEEMVESLTDSSELSWLFEDSDGDGPDEICNVCGNSNHPHRMISCEFCGTVYHLGCIDPPLRDFPVTNWFCSHCDSSSDSD